MSNINELIAKRIMLNIKENSEKLETCSGHSFGDVLGNHSASGKWEDRPTCSKCGGYMSLIAIYNYTSGYKAAGGNPDDVAKYVDGTSV